MWIRYDYFLRNFQNISRYKFAAFVLISTNIYNAFYFSRQEVVDSWFLKESISEIELLITTKLKKLGPLLRSRVS